MSAKPAIVSFDGDLDYYRFAEVHRTLQNVVDAECAVVDLERARYIEAFVLGALARLAAERHAARRRAPLIVVPDPRLRRLFEITGVDAIVDLCETTEQAHALCAPVGV